MKKECIDTIIGKSYVGDWFLFYLLGQNIDSVIFKVRLNGRHGHGGHGDHVGHGGPLARSEY